MKLDGMLVVGECMIEFSGGTDAIYQQGFAGDALNTAWHTRQHLRPNVPVGFFTALGSVPSLKGCGRFFIQAEL